MDLCEPESTLGLAGTGAGSALATNSGLPQHPAERRPERPVLLAGDQEPRRAVIRPRGREDPDYVLPVAVGPVAVGPVEVGPVKVAPVGLGLAGAGWESSPETMGPITLATMTNATTTPRWQEGSEAHSVHSGQAPSGTTFNSAVRGSSHDRLAGSRWPRARAPSPAASRPAPPGASGPPRGRSTAPRRRGSWGRLVGADLSRGRP